MGTQSTGVIPGSGDQAKTKAALADKNKSSPDFALLQDKFVDENIGAHTRVNFFFLGDLVYILLDTLHLAKEKYGADEIKMILSSFDYYDFYGSPRIANMAHIPVACDYFFEWYTSNVIGEGECDEGRTAYPIVYFIRALCNHFLNELLYEVCQNKSAETKVIFYDAALFVPNRDGADPFKTALADGKFANASLNTFTVDATQQYKSGGMLPLHHDLLLGTKVKDMFNYLLIYPVITPFLHPVGRGNPEDDRDRGVHHFHIGAPTGLVKKIDFSKTDIAYLRESRFVNQGDLGLLQLGAVYRVKVDMFGNTIYSNALKFVGL